MVHLAPPRLEDAEELLDFELANRAFFEAHINARPADYYDLAGVRAALQMALDDEAQDRAYQHLVRDSTGTLVGRVNLSRVRRAHFHSAELGYRIAQAACGRGHATRAVGAVIDRAFGPLRLQRLEATARPDNLGSGRVLLNNGFIAFGHSRRSFELGGVWHDLVHYERHASF